MSGNYTPEEKQAMRDWLKEQVAVIKALCPMMAEAADQEADEIRNPLMACIRGAEADKDTEVLALVAAWLLLRADKATLLGLLMFLEDDGGEE
jgi:hypothetical protein